MSYIALFLTIVFAIWFGGMTIEWVEKKIWRLFQGVKW